MLVKLVALLLSGAQIGLKLFQIALARIKLFVKLVNNTNLVLQKLIVNALNVGFSPFDVIGGVTNSFDRLRNAVAKLAYSFSANELFNVAIRPQSARAGVCPAIPVYFTKCRVKNFAGPCIISRRFTNGVI